MKRIHLTTILIGVAVLMSVASDGFARGRMYHPGLGRYMQRDPIGTSIRPLGVRAAGLSLSRNISDAKFTQRDPVGQYSDGANLYQYVKSNPVNDVDPSGLLVDAVYDKSKTNCNLTVKDRDSGKTLTVDAESGGKPYGDPIPNGGYEILDQQRKGTFRLDANDEKPRNDIHEPSGRDQFRLHGPGRTVGCIEVKKEEEWKKVEEMIHNTKNVEEVDVTSTTWWGKVNKEKVKKFGDLTVK